MKMDFVRIDGNRFAYRRQGEGDPVLLVHRVAGSSFLRDDTIDGGHFVQKDWAVKITNLHMEFCQK